MSVDQRPRPTRDEMVEAIGPDTKMRDLVQRFGFSNKTVKRLMEGYGIPPLPDGRRFNSGGVFPDPNEPMRPIIERPRAPIDDLCDAAHADWKRRSDALLKYRLKQAGSKRPPPPLHLDPEDDWRDYAMCAGLDPNIFMPTTRTIISTRMAKTICAACPVREVCPVSETTRHLRRRQRPAAA